MSNIFISCSKNEIMTPVETEQLMQSKSAGRQTNDIIFYGLTDNNELIKYSKQNKLNEEAAMSITGLQTGEKIQAIDFRPATGELYGVTNASRLYIINTTSGKARVVNATPFTPAIAGNNIGFDFNPTVDRIRLVTNTGQNLRLNPETGTVAATDGNINPGTPAITSVAYTNNFAGATMTTLYDIDVTSDKLYIQTPPNNGTLTPVGSLGINATNESGFDISPDGIALAVIYGTDTESEDGDAGLKTRLYTIDLQTGRAKNTGKFARKIIGLAIPTNPVAYAVSDANNLLIFNPTMASSTISKAITGLQSGEMILGIDFRPLNGQLYALGSTSRIYTINSSNGAATAVGSPFTPSLEGSSFGFDFNPLVDRIRVVSNTGQNLRIVPMTGAVAFVDGPLNPGTPMVSAAAYLNNFAGTTTTTLYDLDHNTDKLYRQDPPNSGTLVEIGALGIDISSANGFDIGSTSNMAYALLTTGSTTKLYSINLATGMATEMSGFGEKANGFTIGLGF